MKRLVIGLWLTGGMLAVGTLSPQDASAAGAERVALVIGNSSYRTAELDNPKNDARDVAELLKQAGFQVELGINTTRTQLLELLQDFGETIKNKRTKFAVFYYAGHGAQQSWRNFLIPVDANVQSGDDVADMAVDLSELTTEMARTRDRNFLMILDACRNDPFGSAYRPVAKGLSQYDAPAGSLLAYATGPGRVASDGSGRNGLYTQYLLSELSVKGTRVEDAFKRVRLGVRLASRGRQIPWESTSLEEDIYIFPQPRRAELSNAQLEELLDREIAAWHTAKSANSVDALAAFLRAYPSGNVSELALSRLNTMLREQAPRPRLAQLHVPELASTAPSAQTMVLASAPGAMSVLRAGDAQEQTQTTTTSQQFPASIAVPSPMAAPLPPTLAPAVLADVTAPTSPAPIASPQAAAAALAVSPEPSTKQTPIDLSSSSEIVVAAAPPVTPTPKAIAPPISAHKTVAPKTAAPVASAAVVTAAVDAYASQDLTVPATPMYHGSYEYIRHFQVGDVFKYQVINRFNSVATPLEMRVTAIDPQKDEVTYNGGAFVSDGMGNVVKNLRGAMESPRQFYPAELYVGKRWTTMFRQSREGGRSYTFKYQLKVVGKETVTVPAGQFDTYKIEARGFNMQRGAALERDIWIAPGVDADIAHETKVRLANGGIEQYDRQELIEFPKR
ncbi:caspase family protein [Variovorax sp. J22R133]|uniref:caspase family protein n=1 Tax=Variovorax brevis TaxID=3053503 RepID=UPI00257642D9|nr:caspase family protein [Variovorax sp. J22R133]MDM0110518.1 caspase family protein [Variovorax sp. J22R133]